MPETALPLSTRVSPQIHEMITQRAHQERRTVSQMLALILEDALSDHVKARRRELDNDASDAT